MKAIKEKTYILIGDVHNDETFPIGTVVKITDDYWGRKDYSNTGFTVVKGKLKGKKGCVANGLKGWLVNNTKRNRLLISNIIRKENELKKAINKNWKRLNAMQRSKLPNTN